MKPRLLDLFCCAGGAAKGYADAGFDVTGVDIRPQPRYPFAFVQGDALAYLAEHGWNFDAVHASPPCQQYSVTRSRHKDREYPDLLAATRSALILNDRAWVIENVVGAPFHFHVQLCGTMFGLRVYRHRRFESSFLMFQPHHPKHSGPALYQRGRKARYEAGGFVTVTGNVGSYCGPAMGIDWMTGEELSQAIPPAYTKWIGEHLMRVLRDQGRLAA